MARPLIVLVLGILFCIGILLNILGIITSIGLAISFPILLAPLFIVSIILSIITTVILTLFVKEFFELKKEALKWIYAMIVVLALNFIVGLAVSQFAINIANIAIFAITLAIYWAISDYYKE